MERKTLLLSPNYVPLQILHWQEAVKQIYEDNVEVLVSYNEEIRGASVVWKWPAVMKLHRLNKSENKRPVRFSRTAVYERDAYRCQYCAKRFSYDQLTLDHVWPSSKGGQTTFRNCVAACKRCNGEKGNKSCDEWGRWPLKKPVAPTFLRDPGPRITSETIPEEWKRFVSAE